MPWPALKLAGRLVIRLAGFNTGQNLMCSILLPPSIYSPEPVDDRHLGIASPGLSSHGEAIGGGETANELRLPIQCTNQATNDQDYRHRGTLPAPHVRPRTLRPFTEETALVECPLHPLKALRKFRKVFPCYDGDDRCSCLRGRVVYSTDVTDVSLRCLKGARN